MSAAVASRAVLRQTILRRAPQIRNASTTSDAAAKAKDVASNATSRASEGLTKVTASATSAISKAGPALGSALGKVGGRTGRLIGAVQSLIPPTIYYSRVTAELAKAIFHGQKMYPPTTAQFQQYFQPLINVIRNPSQLSRFLPSNPQQYLQQVRNLSTTQLTAYGIIAAELLGFFTIGEIIGKLKLVGYRGSNSHH